MNSVKRNQRKPSTVPTNRRRTLHLYFSYSKSITSSAIPEVNGRIVDYSLYYWLFIIHFLNLGIYHSLFGNKKVDVNHDGSRSLGICGEQRQRKLDDC